jgi:NAD-dependent deacetylase
MKPKMQQNKVVIFSGAGLSAESGLPTFRDADGLWNNHSWFELASPAQPEAVLAFYNERRRMAWSARPNAAHLAIAALEAAYEVVVITQNVDALHERAGSSNVIHLHGELEYARGTSAEPKRYRLGGDPIAMGQLCEDGTQLRPDVVWFGEETRNMDEARRHLRSAGKVLVVGTSLIVQPAASLTTAAHYMAEKILVAKDRPDVMPRRFRFACGNAATLVPRLAQRWMAEAGVAFPALDGEREGGEQAVD